MKPLQKALGEHLPWSPATIPILIPPPAVDFDFTSLRACSWACFQSNRCRNRQWDFFLSNSHRSFCLSLCIRSGWHLQSDSHLNSHLHHRFIPRVGMSVCLAICMPDESEACMVMYKDNFTTAQQTRHIQFSSVFTQVRRCRVLHAESGKCQVRPQVPGLIIDSYFLVTSYIKRFTIPMDGN